MTFLLVRSYKLTPVTVKRLNKNQHYNRPNKYVKVKQYTKDPTPEVELGANGDDEVESEWNV